MKFPRQEIARLLAMSSLLLCMNARADWAQSTDVLVVKPGPALGQVQAQNPPGFTWARHPTGPAQYEVEITLARRRADHAPSSSATGTCRPRPWPTATTAGACARSARPTGRRRAASSSPPRSTVFEVPDNATLRSRILAARPSAFAAAVVRADEPMERRAHARTRALHQPHEQRGQAADQRAAGAVRRALAAGDLRRR